MLECLLLDYFHNSLIAATTGCAVRVKCTVAVVACGLHIKGVFICSIQV